MAQRDENAEVSGCGLAQPTVRLAGVGSGGESGSRGPGKFEDILDSRPLVLRRHDSNCIH